MNRCERLRFEQLRGTEVTPTRRVTSLRVAHLVASVAFECPPSRVLSAKKPSRGMKVTRGRCITCTRVVHLLGSVAFRGCGRSDNSNSGEAVGVFTRVSPSHVGVRGAVAGRDSVSNPWCSCANAIAGVARQEARAWNGSNARAVRYSHSCRPFGSQRSIWRPRPFGQFQYGRGG